LLAAFGIARLDDGRVRLEVQRPQHTAKAERAYASVDDVRRALSDMGVPPDISEFYLKV